MSKVIKDGFSITILTMLLTTIILAVLGWTGTGTLKAYSAEIDVKYVKDQLETMNQTLSEILVVSHEKRLIVHNHEIRITNCEKDFSKLETAAGHELLGILKKDYKYE